MLFTANQSRALQASSFLNLKIVAFTLLFIFSGLHYFRRRNQRKKEKKLLQAFAEQNSCKPVLPSVPYKWPFAFDLLKRQFEILLSDHAFEQFTEYMDIAGTVRIGLFGAEGYFTTDPENIEAILSTRFEDWSLGSRRLAAFPMLGEGIFGQDGPAWKRSRELIRHQFVRVQKQTLQVFTPLTKDLVASMGKLAAPDGRLDLGPLLFEYTLNGTTKLLFGEPHNSLSREKQDAIHKDFDLAAVGVVRRLRLADIAWLYNPPAFRRACKGVKEWATFFAKKALKYKDEVGKEKAFEKYPFIVDLWEEMQDEGLVRDQLLHILFAGRDSTADLLCWTFFHLVRNPKALKRLVQEISAAPRDGDITREQIQTLQFLRCCLNEILRLYPTPPLNLRFSNKTTILPRGGGPDQRSPVLLPKGTGIAWSTYHLHRLESLYGPDPRVFRPERWESGELIKKVRLGVGFVDFNGGPRLCLGKDFALMEASYAVIRILQAYPNIRLPPDVANEPVGAERQHYTVGLAPTDGVEIMLK